mmetsp:Transcript_4931/g.11679  ORF Transcript_4931/g.11679 Transcript_4931/m.11679 type:complete len:214 (-) Transcript_4931:408-1049(-)
MAKTYTISVNSIRAQNSDFIVEKIEVMSVLSASTKRKRRITRTVFRIRVRRMILAALRLEIPFMLPTSLSTTSCRIPAMTSQSEVITINMSSKLHIQSSEKRKPVRCATTRKSSSAANKKAYRYCMMRKLSSWSPAPLVKVNWRSMPRKAAFVSTTMPKKMSKPLCSTRCFTVRLRDFGRSPCTCLVISANCFLESVPDCVSAPSLSCMSKLV